MIDHPRLTIQRSGERYEVGTLRDRAVREEAAAVGERGRVAGHAEDRSEPQLAGEPIEGPAGSEWHDLHGEAALFTQPRDALLGVGDDDEPPRRARDQTLAREGAAATLDQPEGGVDLVGAVDDEVDGRHRVGLGEGDAELGRQGHRRA